MPLDRMPSISVGIIVHVGAVYDASYHWRNEVGGYSDAHIQGDPPALRELAAALVQAADLADAAASVLAEGMAG